MQSVFRRLKSHRPGGVTIIDYTMMALVGAYAAIQFFVVVGTRSGPF